MFDRFRKRPIAEIADELRERLVEMMGQHLLSLVQYFPERCVGQHTGRQPHRLHVLIVLKEIDVEVLTRCSSAMRAAKGHEAIVPMVLSQAELMASTDVFPITFLEMKHDYCVLAGDDLLASLSISDAHLRLRCEQELKNLLLRMQSAFLLRCHRTQALLNSLEASYSTFLRCLRAAIQVIGEAVPDENERIVELAVGRLGLNRDVLARVNETCNAPTPLGSAALREVYGQLLIEVHRAAAAVDEHEGEGIVQLDPIDD